MIYRYSKKENQKKPKELCWKEDIILFKLDTDVCGTYPYDRVTQRNDYSCSYKMLSAPVGNSFQGSRVSVKVSIYAFVCKYSS